MSVSSNALKANFIYFQLKSFIVYDLAPSPNFGLITGMMEQAILKLDGPPILHSDQEWQYQMESYRKILEDNGIQQSMSRKGNCLDNGAMESFFARLKTECYYGNRFETFEQLEKAIHEYIHERIQVKLKGLGPMEYRTQSLNLMSLTFWGQIIFNHPFLFEIKEYLIIPLQIRE